MAEAFGLAFQFVLAGGVILAVVVTIQSFFPSHTIPQDEIDAEARRLIVQHGDGAVEAAEGQALRSQWAKGGSNAMERSERVLKAVREKLE